MADPSPQCVYFLAEPCFINDLLIGDLMGCKWPARDRCPRCRSRPRAPAALASQLCNMVSSCGRWLPGPHAQPRRQLSQPPYLGDYIKTQREREREREGGGSRRVGVSTPPLGQVVWGMERNISGQASVALVGWW